MGALRLVAYSRIHCIQTTALSKEPSMTHSRRVILSVFITALAGAVQAQAPSTAAPTSLVGSWTVDLRPTPEAAPYLKKLVITAVAGGRLEGHFYDGSRIQAGRQTLSAGLETHFAFFTDPGEGAYQSAGRQVSQDRLAGMTLSTTRGFLALWEATRDVAQ
jgi:hypothetical protein